VSQEISFKPSPIIIIKIHQKIQRNPIQIMKNTTNMGPFLAMVQQMSWAGICISLKVASCRMVYVLENIRLMSRKAVEDGI
jgi:hypothetical protein